ncbi:MAG TPA: hypothetical protein VLE20_14060, partial [Blastocatellia bacterium]|nr:hypothetical protein [Blastocatellia bacterium]
MKIGGKFLAKAQRSAKTLPGILPIYDEVLRSWRCFASLPETAIRPSIAAVVSLALLLPLPLFARQTPRPRTSPSRKLTPATVDSVGMSSERLARITPAVQRYIDEGKLAGATVLVERHGRVV